MELTLRFRGELPAAARVSDKHRIRKQLHEQLAVHWQESRLLNDTVRKVGGLNNLQIAKRSKGHFDVDRPLIGYEKFFWRYPLCGFDFIPLVTHVHELHCHLDIRLHRKIGLGGILFEGGDLDNCLKTFFDALRIPEDESQLPAEENIPENTKDWPPFFCLLDNDKAITKLSISTLKLLGAVPDSKHPENYCEIDMDVIITPATPISGNIGMIFP